MFPDNWVFPDAVSGGYNEIGQIWDEKKMEFLSESQTTIDSLTGQLYHPFRPPTWDQYCAMVEWAHGQNVTSPALFVTTNWDLFPTSPLD
ncbi:MAG: hypothetical protein ACTSVZ_03280 [Promethearchaeota archaeon]